MPHPHLPARATVWPRLCLALLVAGTAFASGCDRLDETPPTTNQPALRDLPGNTPPATTAAPATLPLPAASAASAALPSDPATPSEGNRSPAQGDATPVPATDRKS